MYLENYDDKKEILKEKFEDKFGKCIYEEKMKKEYLEIVFLCIGTDKITGDSFGPLVGSRLKELLEECNIFNINVYGTLQENICYTNIKEAIKTIEKDHPNACIVVIDAALSNEENIGKIYVDRKKMILAKGLHKPKVEVGDISIKAVVGKNYKLSKYNFVSLQNISLNVVITLSQIVAKGIYEVIKYV